MPSYYKKDISKLEQSIEDIEKFEKDLQDAIKDEKEAQIMYAGITRIAETLSRTVPETAYGVKVYPNYMIESTRIIQDIIREEAAHEHKFATIFAGMQSMKRRLKEEIQEQHKLTERQERQEREQEAQRGGLDKARITEFRRRGSGYR